MTFVEPLQLETWFVNIFAGSPYIFGIIGILLIATMAGMFGFTLLSLFMMVGIFVLMFTETIPPSLFIFVSIIASLAIGTAISKIMK